MEGSLSIPMYSLQDIPGRGKGLVANEKIPRGTRILCEEPIITEAEDQSTVELRKSIIEQFEALSESNRQAFLAMRNILPECIASELPLGIYRTNALPIEAGGIGGGIFLEASRLNHACDNNAQKHWNDNIKRHTVHALRDIEKGEEITIYYLGSDRSRKERQEALRAKFKFDCTCRLCSLPIAQSQESDRRFEEIARLERLIGAGGISAIVSTALRTLRYVDQMVTLYDEQGLGDAGLARAFFDATQIALSNGDLVRGSVFAEKVVFCWQIAHGSDSKEVIEYGSLAQDPSKHSLFRQLAGFSSKWKTALHEKPQGVGLQEYEDWLWKREKIIGLRNRIGFPPFFSLPSEYENDADSEHWCYLGEIVGSLELLRWELHLKDVDDMVTNLFFYTDGRGNEVASSLKIGHTMAVLDAKRRQFMDGQIGIRLENHKIIKIFPLSLHKLLTMNDEIQKFSTPNVDGTRNCHGCGRKANSLQKCGKCLSFWYCGKDCQMTGWNAKGHKSICKLLEDPDLRRLFFFDWDTHEGTLEFPLPEDDSEG
ncbi:hypothetical protein HYALB_00007602 [Hymenoscyphus albidus]|uniref:Suppressor of anucleate metulae protein B n=1 Tax=Hymenoscyphus albidus TaxID=595503 RepID=A0A9N9PYS9_9HELO|nr:hypothetical protein HYALB_00007602 [Hymenoscyphus albidus]